MTVTALIVAAGKGERLGGDEPKQFRSLGGMPVLRRAVMAFADHPAVNRVRVVVADGQIEDAYRAVGGGFGNVEPIIGGATRGESVRNGLAVIDGDVVLIHDAARPFCPPEVIDRLAAQLEFFEGAVPVLPINDTLARWTELLGEPIDRQGAVRVQTPQAFRLAEIKDAYARWEGPFPSDDSLVARAAGLEVAAVAGAHELDKLTTPDDWARAEERIAARTHSRTGLGFDVHAFAGDGPIMLGGIAVPHARGLAGHSDADVVLHAITDALLGAAGLGDIGQHFPPSDPQWKGASSDLFLVDAAARVSARGGIIDHVDCTIIAEEPKIGPYRDAMRSRIADILKIGVDQVSIKATTTEGLGFTGRREGMAAQAVASIRLARNA
ncbi:MAG TPA: bifunctional 2-C-methyl-D-erythritol 4-phosphate cytidylyltransferase/2-C-methyl-D-erythritol 2,4-cyclodiphosphate synthase [Sphingomicrobium sp.]|nr:bifunctional 2-C-methyl-D-erythritol 4-phosphate cytidylyltransferase/2-C-methyl-D-erythritol 2,4-cyclodiphosphate synthase [Sphingomicrobium sp.]